MKSSTADSIVRLAIDRWQFTALVFVLVTALGLNAFFGIPRTEDPQISMPTYFIAIAIPGAPPQDVEQQVTKPIEDALAGLDNLREIKSTSGDGVAYIQAEYLWGSDPDRKYDEVVREVNRLRPELPDIARLEIERGRPTVVPFIEVALTSDILPMRSLQKLGEDLRSRLARVPGVRKAEVFGAPQMELRVAIDAARLAALRLPAESVANALRSAGVEGPIGAVNAGARRFNVRYAGAYTDPARVRATVIAHRQGAPVTVGDVAQVSWESREASHVTRFGGRRALIVTAQQIDGQDIGAISGLVDAQLSAFQTRLPGSVKLERGFMQAENVRNRMGRLTVDFLLALAIVSVTLLPLGWRAAGIVMTVIPVSLLIGVAVVSAAGYSLNQLTVAGFVLSLGLLVDDAIVVVENIERWLRDGYSRLDATIGGTSQIMLAVLGCTACLMLAFLPLIALPEASGAFIRSLPIAVLGTIAGSLVVALTLVPLLAARFLPREKDPQGNFMLRRMHRGIQFAFTPILHRALNRPWPALGVIAAIAVLAVPLTAAIGSSLFPPAQLPQFLVRVEMPVGTALQRTDAVVRQVDSIVRSNADVTWTIANTGRGNPQLYYNVPPRVENAAYGEIAVGLRKWDNGRSPELIDRLRRQFDAMPGARVTVYTFMQGALLEAPVAIRLLGPDNATLTRLAQRSEAALRTVPGLRDVGNPLRLPRTDLRLSVDEARAQALGVPAGGLRQAVQIALGGATVAIARDSDGDDYPVTARLPQRDRVEIGAIGQIQIPTGGGTSVPLSAVADPVLESTPSEIAHYQRERSVTLTAQVRAGHLTSQANEMAIEALRRDVKLPPGYSMKVGGEAEDQARSFSGLLPAVITAAIGILAVLVLEFRALRTVLVVLGVVPLGLFGAVAALWLTGNSLSFTAAVGLIALIGIEIKNSILLVDFTEQLRRQGLDCRAAVELAGEQRFMPVLLTSITAIGGLIPLAIEGNGLYSPMAIAMIGGLLTSTLLARIATPVMYLLLAPGKRRAADLLSDVPAPQGSRV